MTPQKIAVSKGTYYRVGDLIRVDRSTTPMRVTAVAGAQYIFVVRASRYRRVLMWIKRRLP